MFLPPAAIVSSTLALPGTLALRLCHRRFRFLSFASRILSCCMVLRTPSTPFPPVNDDTRCIAEMVGRGGQRGVVTLLPHIFFIARSPSCLFCPWDYYKISMSEKPPLHSPKPPKAEHGTTNPEPSFQLMHFAIQCSTMLIYAHLCSFMLYSALLCSTLLYSALLCSPIAYPHTP